MREYGETTAITGFPLWIAYVPILGSLAMLVVASVITLVDAIADARGEAAR